MPGGEGATSIKGVVKLAGLRFAQAEGGKALDITLDTDVKVALLHYAPCPDTLNGERLEIYPFLGCYLLGEAVDRGGATLTVHGHAHRGTERGLTAGGHHVRNVAQPVIGHAYRLYCLHSDGDGADPECAAPASNTALAGAGQPA